jgi:hypothetical protein
MNLLPTLIFAVTNSQDLFPQSTPAQVGANTLIFLFGALLVLGLLVLYIWMLIHCLVKPVKNKWAWFFAMFFLGPIVSIIYFFTGRKNLETPIQPDIGIAPPAQPQAPLQ